MTTFERLRTVPRSWLVGWVSGAVAVVLIVVAALTSGDERITIADPAPTTDRSPVAESTSAGSTAAPTSSSPDAESASPSTSPSTTIGNTFTTIDIDDNYELDIDITEPAVAGRSIPDDPPDDESPAPTVEPPPWAASTRLTPGGHLATDVGCAENRSAEALDLFFSARVGPVLGWDYQHVYPLGDDRFLWIFQDAFLDHTGTRTTLGTSRFIHNAAMLQVGACFTLLHRGTADQPAPFEIGDGTVDVRSKWLWPMGGELVDGDLHVFWVEMLKDPYDPEPPDGLGWHPNRTLLASYDALTLERTEYRRPPDPGVVPIYGYAVSSDETHTYLFGNTFEQNLVREGGFWNGPHSATKMYLARVPFGRLMDPPEYAAGQGWSRDPADAVPIVDRFFAENPMQPRYLDGQWVAATAVDGYWGDHLAIDVAPNPWGPWSTIEYSPLLPRNADPKMNTYHAHVLPWRDAFGSIQITVSNNARNMRRDAWNSPHRYRPTVIFRPYAATPTPPSSTTTSTPTSSSTTTVPPSSTTSTTAGPTTTTSIASSTTTATAATTSTTSSTTTTTTSTTTTTTSSTTTTTSTTTPETTAPVTAEAPPDG